MAFVEVAANTLDDAYEISNSLRFNDADDAKLTFTPSSAGNVDRWTLSFWFKRTVTDTPDTIFQVEENSQNDNTIMYVGSAGDVKWEEYQSSQLGMLASSAKLLDTSAWYHTVYTWDSGNGTAGDRMKMYINGSEVTAFGTDNNPDQNQDSLCNGNREHWIGGWDGYQTESNNLDGYLAEVAFCDGTAYAASDFGKTNNNGVWIPKKLDVTFGSQGYYLEFKQTGTSANASGIGADTSGNTNHWAVTNLAATDITVDTPTNNFCTLNFLDKGSEVNSTIEGNTGCTWNAANGHTIRSTMAVANGKWYWEITNADNLAAGIVSTDEPIVPSSGSLFPGGSGYGAGNSYAYILGDGKTRTNNSQTSYGESVATSETLGCALDLDNGKIYWSVDGTWQNSGNPANETNPAYTGITTGSTFFSPAFGYQTNGSSTLSVNFGNPSYAISSGNADANGYGNFEYAPPSGFYALCTKNLAEFG